MRRTQVYGFARWLKELSSVAHLDGYRYNLVENTGQDCWRYYFDGDYTPSEALMEDRMHAD